MTTDDSLIAGAAGGDGTAFSRLVGPHHTDLLRFAARILDGDRAAGEDVVQEAMLCAYRALRQGSRPESVRPWLFVIVRNCALNARRRSKRTLALPEAHGSSPQRIPSEAAEQGEWIDWLMSAIADLPARQRQALVGREFEGRSHAELAASLGTSALAVKTLLHRARGTLRRLRAESMLSAPLFVKGRLAGAKAGAGLLCQSLFVASVTSLVVLAVHAGGVGSVRAAGLPAGHARVWAHVHHLLPGGPVGSRQARHKVEREGRHAIARCDRGLTLRGISAKGLRYGVGHLSSDELEYTDCQRLLRRAALVAAFGPSRACPHQPPARHLRRTGAEALTSRRPRSEAGARHCAPAHPVR